MKVESRVNPHGSDVICPDMYSAVCLRVLPHFTHATQASFFLEMPQAVSWLWYGRGGTPSLTLYGFVMCRVCVLHLVGFQGFTFILSLLK